VKKKSVTIFVIFVALFSLLTVSLARWQLIEGAKWAALAESNRKYSKSIQNQRGIIRDRDGIILASNEIVYNISVDEKNVKDLATFVPKLAEILEVTSDAYQDSMVNKNVKYFSIAKKVTQDKRDAAAVYDCQQNIPAGNRNYACDDIKEVVSRTAGIYIEQTSKRIYPNGALASHVLGFVGQDSNGDEIGSNGVEGYYDQYLVGKTGTIEGIRDQSGNFILSDNLQTNSGEDGTYIQLTIDSGIQKIAEDKLKAQVNATGAKGGTAVIMDPSNGEILAMANYPTFDSSQYFRGEIIDCSVPHYQSYKTCDSTLPPEKRNPEWAKKIQSEKDAVLQQERNIPGVFTNQGLSEVREPGSIMKLITTSAAINEGKVNANTKVPDHPGCIMITDRKICTADFVGAKNQSVEKVISISDNIGAYYIAKSIGAQKLYSYLDAFGIGKEARVGLDGESIFPMKSWEDWTEIDLATASFGQGVVSTNSIENIDAVATIANKGKRIQPHIISKFVTADKVKDFSPQVVSQPITESTAKQMVDLMTQATSENYTAPVLKDLLKNYTIAGKTGTAQIPDGKGGYVKEAYNNTFIGFAPASNPKFIMLVTIREPAHGTYAGFSAVPVWRDIAADLLPYMGVVPDKK